MQREEPYCPECGKGADYILSDASAQWDVDLQDWVLVDVQDAYICTFCDMEWSRHKDWRDLPDGST